MPGLNRQTAYMVNVSDLSQAQRVAGRCRDHRFRPWPVGLNVSRLWAGAHTSFRLVRSGPLALSEYGYAFAVDVNAVDVNFIGTDHPVDVDEAFVAALRSDLLRRQLGTIDEAFRIALAERDV